MNIEDLKKKIAELPAEDLQSSAAGLDISVDELKDKYATAIADIGKVENIQLEMVGKASTEGACTTQSFKVGIKGLMEIKGTVTFCTGSCWSAKVEYTLYLVGIKVGTYKYSLSCNNAQSCLSVDIGVAKATVCVGIKGANHCFYVSGKACYWDAWKWKWQCESFDETIICFG